jgi:hypothetical protein
VTTIRIGGVRFKVYPQDHLPMHVHADYQGIQVIVDLTAEATVSLADRDNAVQPGNAKRSQVRHILNLAAANFDTLVAAWRAMEK